MGSAIDLFDINLSTNPSKSPIKKIANVWHENRHDVQPGTNRAHIAHLERMEQTNPNWLSGACFDASFRIFDVESGSLVSVVGDKGNFRYWQTMEMDRNLVVSCADDELMKLWDLRVCNRPVAISPRHDGRISCMLKYHPSERSSSFGSDEQASKQGSDRTSVSSRSITSSYIISASCPNNPRASDSKAQFRIFDIRNTSEDIELDGAFHNLAIK